MAYQLLIIEIQSSLVAYVLKEEDRTAQLCSSPSAPATTVAAGALVTTSEQL